MHCVVAHCRYGGWICSLASPPSPSPSRDSSAGSRLRYSSSRGRQQQRFQQVWRNDDGRDDRSRVLRFRSSNWTRNRRDEGRDDDDSERYFVPRDQGDDDESDDDGFFSDADDEANTKQQPEMAEPKALARDFLKKLRSRRFDVKYGRKDGFTDLNLSLSSFVDNCFLFMDVLLIKASDEENDRDSIERRRSFKRTESETNTGREPKRFGSNLTSSRLKYESKETDLQTRRSFTDGRKQEYSSRTLSAPVLNNKAYDSEDEYFRRDRRERPERPRRENAASDRDEKTKRVDAFFSTRKFQSLGASPEMIAALSSLEITKPSEIQAISYKQVLSGTSCIIADQTGSGKTLAYLAPLVQRLRQDEENGNFSTPKNPRVLILAPTSELAMQVLSVCRALSTTCPLKSMVATGGFRWKTQVENLAIGPDIVIATPGRFLHHLDQETIQLSKLQSVVLDEVDILFEEEEFVEAMQRVRKLAASDVQYVHVTATLPTDVHDKILNKHPDSVPVLGPSLHLTAPGLNEILVDCSGDENSEKTPEAAFENKKKELLNLIAEKSKSATKTIVFCNKIETCRRVENILKRYDRSSTKMSVLPYHAALSQEVRLQSLQEFLSSQKPDLPTILVCTDRASRGLDSIGVERVILFDYPRDPSEYIRRVGRTARAGNSGKVFVFVVGKQVSLARKVMSRNEKRHPVHAVPGSSA